MSSDPNPELLSQIRGENFLPSISVWKNLGGLLIAGTFGCAFILANVTQYNVTVKAPGIVRPSGEIRLVQATSEGTVRKFLVKENQVVKQGDTLMYLDDSQLKIKKSQILGNIQQNQLELSKIDAQIQLLQAQITAESTSKQRVIASAKADFSRVVREYEDRQITTQAELEEAEATLELAREELKRYQQLGSTGAIASLQIKEKEQAFKAAIAKFKRAKATLNPSNATVAVAQERIAQEKAEGESTLASLNKEKQELIQHQVKIRTQVGSFEKELKQIEIELQKTEIKATETGTILKLELRNVGQVVRSGETIAHIAPDRAPIIVKARVEPQDISNVQVCKAKQVSDCKQGQVILRISAYPYPDYGTINGVVRAITADTMPSQNSLPDAMPHYEVTIEPVKLELNKGNQTFYIQPGMEVTADIISKQDTMLNFILRKARLITDL